MKKSFIIGGVMATSLLLGVAHSAGNITSLVNKITMPRATPISVEVNPEQSTTIDLNALLRQENINQDGKFITEDTDPTIGFNPEKNTADFANTTAGKYPILYEICTENTTLNDLELNYWHGDTGGDMSTNTAD